MSAFYNQRDNLIERDRILFFLQISLHISKLDFLQLMFSSFFGKEIPGW